MRVPERHADLLLELLAREDVACPNCGYNLRGLTSDRCPECHQALTVRVALTEPTLAPFLFGLIGLASFLGFMGCVLVFIIGAEVAGTYHSPWVDYAVLCGIMLALLGLIIFWIRARQRWLTRRSRRQRWTAACVLVGLGLCMIVSVFLLGS